MALNAESIDKDVPAGTRTVLEMPEEYNGLFADLVDMQRSI